MIRIEEHNSKSFNPHKNGNIIHEIVYKLNLKETNYRN